MVGKEELALDSNIAIAILNEDKEVVDQVRAVSVLKISMG